MPFFSIVIPTRDRSTSFRQALESVLAQGEQDIEIIVVNDGSNPDHQPIYEAIINNDRSGKVRYFSLLVRPSGHGGSYTRNFGVAQARGTYLCFLDDDDCWTDPGHLARARQAIETSATSVDLFLTNQAAFLHDKQQPGPIWIEDLPPILARSGNLPDQQQIHTVTVEELLQSRGFCHLNTLIVRRALYNEIGGLDERNSWEHDRDIYLRLLDVAATIKYAPVTVARHNIPDIAGTSNVTTSQSEFERRLSQLRLLDRAILSARHAAIRAYGRQHKIYTLKRIAESLARSGRRTEAAYYAREALGAKPTAKWALYTAWCTLLGMLDRSRH